MTEHSITGTLDVYFEDPSVLRAMQDDEHPRCIACAAPLKLGDMVFHDADGGLIHADCIGSDREAFVNLDTGEPLAADDPLPVPHVWFADTPETQAAFKAGRAAQWQPIAEVLAAKETGEYVLLWLGGLYAKPAFARWYEPWGVWREDPNDPGPDDECAGIGEELPTHFQCIAAPSGQTA